MKTETKAAIVALIDQEVARLKDNCKRSLCDDPEHAKEWEALEALKAEVNNEPEL